MVLFVSAYFLRLLNTEYVLNCAFIGVVIKPLYQTPHVVKHGTQHGVCIVNDGTQHGVVGMSTSRKA